MEEHVRKKKMARIIRIEKAHRNVWATYSYDGSVGPSLIDSTVL